MTNRDFFASLTAGSVVTDEQAAIALKMIENLDKTNANRKAKSNEKKSAEDAPLMASVVEYLTANAGAHTASEVATACDISTSKATALLKKIDGIVVGETKIKSRVVKTYAIA